MGYNESEGLKQMKSVYANGIPHWKELTTNEQLSYYVFASGGAFPFKDSVGNIHIFGYSQCDNQEKNKSKCDSGTKSVFRMALENDLFFSTDLIKYKTQNDKLGRPIISRYQRKTDGGWLEASVGEAFNGGSTRWKDSIIKRESLGRVPYPYVYCLDDSDFVGWNTIVNDYLPIAATIVGVALAIFDGGASAMAINTAMKVLIPIAQKWVSTGKFEVNEITQVTEAALTPLLEDGDKLPIFDLKLSDASKFSAMASQCYSSIATGDYYNLTNVLGLKNANSIQKALGYIGGSDINSFSQFTSLPIKEAEKIISGVQNTEMVRNLAQMSETIVNYSKANGNAFADMNVQQFMINTVVSAGQNEMASQTDPDMVNLASIVPAQITAVKTIIENKNLDADKFGAMLSLVGSKYSHPTKDFIDLGLESMVERAKHYIGKVFVLPSSIPSDLTGLFANTIEAEVNTAVIIPKNADIKTKYFNGFNLEFM